jgi:hypothetical protein
MEAAAPLEDVLAPSTDELAPETYRCYYMSMVMMLMMAMLVVIYSHVGEKTTSLASNIPNHNYITSSELYQTPQ